MQNSLFLTFDENIQFSKNKLRIAFAKWIGYLSLVDLLILPYFQIIIVPYSLPLLIIGFALLKERCEIDIYMKLFFFIVLSVIVSISISAFIYPYSMFLLDNIKAALQFITSFLYFFYFRALTKKVNINISSILIIFVIWFSFLGIMFLFSPNEVVDIIGVLYGRLVNSEDMLIDFRYSYFFQDPNTAIYFYLVAIAGLLMYARSLVFFLSLMILSAIMVLLSQSSGGLLSYLVMTFLLMKYNNLRSKYYSNKFFLILIMGVIIFVIYFFLSSYSEENEVIESAFNRLFDDNDRYQNGGGRLFHWSALVYNLYPLPIGRGYNLFDDGYAKPPHSDFLGILYRYGLLALVPTMLFLFAKARKKILLIVPAIITFFINSLLDEQKFLALFLSLIAINMDESM